mmetsp:Transcript_10962/g.22952  ORF Transcript_10962/g.22952 Transcript_10962/m.22952 type:complete len:216 (-) Transcript_10962:85-732(-)
MPCSWHGKVPDLRSSPRSMAIKCKEWVCLCPSISNFASHFASLLDFFLDFTRFLLFTLDLPVDLDSILLVIGPILVHLLEHLLVPLPPAPQVLQREIQLLRWQSRNADGPVLPPASEQHERRNRVHVQEFRQHPPHGPPPDVGLREQHTVAVVAVRVLRDAGHARVPEVHGFALAAVGGGNEEDAIALGGRDVEVESLYSVDVEDVGVGRLQRRR